MGFLAKLFGARGGATKGSGGDSGGIHLYVRCAKCGEKVHVRANRHTDISQEYEDGEPCRAYPYTRRFSAPDVRI